MPEARAQIAIDSVEYLSRELARVYAPVAIADNPLYKWLQVVNDVAVVSEQIRRRRPLEANDRLMRVLNRVLEFAGYYLYHRPAEDSTVAAFFARHLREPLVVTGMDNSQPEEGITRWVLAKYPFSCSKCGATNARGVGHCVCGLQPWVFEERRENARGFQRYRRRISANQRRLGALIQQIRARSASRRTSEFFNGEGLFTLPGLIKYFHTIYRSAYYSREPWKTAMHLVEEIGEVSTEIGRLHLLQSVGDALTATNTSLWSLIAANVASRVSASSIQPQARGTLKNAVFAALERARCAESPKDEIARVAASTLKEEFADVLSWIAALLCQLNSERRNAPPDAEQLAAVWSTQGFMGEGDAGAQCRWCRQVVCSDSCLITNAVSAELIEATIKL